LLLLDLSLFLLLTFNLPAMREEHRVILFENTVLKTAFGAEVIKD
jgi:hypothetical protein